MAPWPSKGPEEYAWYDPTGAWPPLGVQVALCVRDWPGCSVTKVPVPVPVCEKTSGDWSWSSSWIEKLRGEFSTVTGTSPELVAVDVSVTGSPAAKLELVAVKP